MKMIMLLSLLLARDAAAGTNPEGIEFLSENAGAEGVVQLPSGLQYKVLRAGTGQVHPTASTPCSCHYAGTLIDGTTFDSSYDRGEPTTFAPNQVIKGWTEAMQLMVEGDLWEMYIPSELAYGDRGSPPKIPGGSALIFAMEILSIDGPTVPANRCDVKTQAGCTEKESKYIDKMNAKLGSVSAELKRLKTMGDAKLAPELKLWLEQRKAILAKLKAQHPEL
ncbi:hypothetical protein M885DRAFT_524679 [Pelagophyceae sp. CCMP2097]|nr:hypothetical protein M885DRAFT_524679 [Pelagophyceae sp. CCMP2097]